MQSMINLLDYTSAADSIVKVISELIIKPYPQIFLSWKNKKTKKINYTPIIEQSNDNSETHETLPGYSCNSCKFVKTKNMDTLIIKPRDKAELNFFLELAKRLGTRTETIEDNADMRLFQAMERNSKTPKISKQKVLDTISQIINE